GAGSRTTAAASGLDPAEPLAAAAGPGRHDQWEKEVGSPGGCSQKQSSARAKSTGQQEGGEDKECSWTAAEERGHPRQSAPVGRGCGTAELSELRIVLLGLSGAGRSATGNTLLGETRFKSQLASQPVTTTCDEGSRSWCGRRVVVLDTPPIFGGSHWDKGKVDRELSCCKKFISHGLYALVLVTQLGRYTKEDWEVQKGVQKAFGRDAMKHMMVVFTCEEDLGGGSLQEYVKTAEGGALQSLVKACGNRYCGVSNRETGPRRDKQADAVLQMALDVAR
ncbi:GIMA1 GTPase, partial [Alectura lathami]|nr:GIMA1 GTPase [Alectura lathami]